MAKELTINLTLGFNKSNISTTMTSGTQQFTVSGTDYVRETMSVPTSVTALPLGGVASPGYCMITNKDVTNYVDVYDSVSGNACIRLLPGEWAMFRFAGTAPAVKAHTAAVKIDFVLIAA
jgi:hypothetical protein